MPTIEINPIIGDATAEVLESMCFIEILGETPQTTVPGADWISAKLYFNGPCSGELGISAPLATERTLAPAFLGEDPAQLDLPQSLEFLCERSNMVCGSLLGRLKEGGVYRLSHPTNAPYRPHLEFSSTCKIFRLNDGELFVWLSVEQRA